MKKLLANLSARQRITIAIVILAAGAGLYSLVEWKKEAGFKPLFTGLAPEDAAGIVQKLKEGGIEYRLPEGGGAVLVPSSRLADLRLSMAAAGLPKTGRIGFELFDKVNLGATEFTEHVNYRRALEGELERTIMTLAEVDQARVHLTFPKESVFLESQQPAKASVLVRLKPGSHLAPQNVVAINHLVASAVEGLAPDAVSVLDMNGNLLSRPRPSGTLDGPEPSAAALDYRRQVEADLLAKINSTLSPILGAEKFRAGVSVECDFSGGELSEELFDPARSVMLSSQRTEDSAGAALSSGVPGTASTLPRPTSRPANGSGKTSRVTENITYQSSRTVKKTRMPAGVVRKISLAVLLDQEVNWQKDQGGYKRVLVPPTPEKLKVIRDLVAGITGYSQERGDQLIIETLPFETTLMLEPPAPARPAVPEAPAGNHVLPVKVDQKVLIFAGAGIAAAILALAGFLILRRKRRQPVVEVPAVPAALPGSPETPPAALPVRGNLENQIESQLAEREALQQRMDAQALNSLKLAPVITKKAEVFAKHLRDKISKEPEISVQILKSWIREGEE
ncbi:MAG TPA: flagellar basal-body MS-ring/collar protein FliF [Verrucomicrobiae bacterium]|nr:flagellar basal-body MS-ring/collar protein FliF [Candidatus Acidoferrales bacterium]HXK07119.1 flagellar basal-body MS-ring/collar protein FliF [Verrucomicrobiae bacterium]